MYFFYGAGCLSCEAVKPLITKLEQKYSQLSVQWFEIYENRNNIDLLNNLFDKYSIPMDQRVVPVVFINNQCLVGREQITTELEGIIQSLCNTGCSCPSIGEDEVFKPISIIVVTWAALVDSINPCAIGVLIFLLSLITTSKDKRRLIKVGIAFTASIYLAYFLFGIGILFIVQIIDLSYYFYKLVGILAIIIGILNIKDFIRYGSLGFKMELPSSLKLKLNNLLNYATSPVGAFIMGFAVCLFELPCTGGPYLYILGLLSKKSIQAFALPLLLHYNLIFVSPEILVTFFVYLGISSTKTMAHLRHKFTKLLHLLLGLTMIAFGIASQLRLI